MSTSSGRCLTVFRLRRPMDIFGSVSFSSSKSSTHLRGKSKSDSFHNIDDCLASFNLMLHSDPPSPIKEFSKLLSALVRMKHYATVISLAKQMEMEDKFGEAVDLFDDIVEKGYQPDVYTYTVIVNGLCKIGKTTVAFGVLKRMVEEGCEPNVVSYSAIIDSLCKDRFVTEALDLFLKIKSEGISPNVVTYNTLIRGLCMSSRWKEAFMLLHQMLRANVTPNIITFNTLVDGLCKEGKVSKARDVVKLMMQGGIQPHVITYNSLMDGY
ncbi:hypothetical protein JCGZ_14931 [Jatropha curcas]|uniref:Pentatricopeptide repeat-containing protein n=1 Tax=Jatropha curcas TaxID=180498 RepID=A0A067K9U0_JATCU|nr:hypothetical protein JCGZ_14931 [Jatropha curcas]